MTLPGIGKKTAERLIVEMRDRLKEWGAVGDTAVQAGSAGASSISKDAETALIALGYKPQQASSAIAKVLKQNPEVEDSEALIRLSLKSML